MCSVSSELLFHTVKREHELFTDGWPLHLKSHRMSQPRPSESECRVKKRPKWLFCSPVATLFLSIISTVLAPPNLMIPLLAICRRGSRHITWGCVFVLHPNGGVGKAVFHGFPSFAFTSSFVSSPSPPLWPFLGIGAYHPPPESSRGNCWGGRQVGASMVKSKALWLAKSWKMVRLRQTSRFCRGVEMCH